MVQLDQFILRSGRGVLLCCAVTHSVVNRPSDLGKKLLEVSVLVIVDIHTLLVLEDY